VIAQDHKTLVRQYFEEVYNRRHLAALDTFVAADQVDRTLPPYLPPTTEGTRRAIGMFLRAFPDLHVTIDDLVAEGDRVVVRFTSRGTQRGPFGLLPPLGRRVTVSSYATLRVADGKIVETWGLDDQLALLLQTGILPALAGLVLLAGLGLGAGLCLLARKARG
jgi:predicted ester cyclase